MEITTELIGLYTNLFVITMTTVGILLASLIALTQLLEPFLVSKTSQKLVHPVTLLLSVIALCLTVVATLPPMVLLAMKPHNFIGWADLGINNWFTNQWYVVAAVILLITSAGLVASFIYQVSRFLVPANALEFLHNLNSVSALKDYFHKSGATRPVRPVRYVTKQEEGGEFFIIEEADEESDRAAAKKYEAAVKKYETDKVKLAKMENPLFPIEAYLIRTIQKGNLTIVSNTLKTFESVIGDLAADKKYGDLSSLVRYYTSVLENANEISHANGLQSVSTELLESSSRVVDILIKENEVAPLDVLLEFWVAMANVSIALNPTVFKRAVSIIGESGQSILKNTEYEWESISDFADNVSRALGLLGEKLLAEGPPEKKAMMIGDSETRFNTLVNAVLNIGWDMHSKRADVYPLIYFDCLYVIAKKLAPYCKDEEDYDRDIGDSLFSLMYELFSFGEAAITAGNLRGAGLALLKLEEHLKIAEQNNLERHKQYALDEVLRLGALAEVADIKGVPEFWYGDGDNLADISIHLLRKYISGHTLDKEAYEVLIKTSTSGKHDQMMGYLRRAGRALGTDFGMNLSEEDND